MTQPQPYAMSDIEAERARAGITCAALAKGVGITPRLYSEYKRGKCRIPLERANAMLAYIYAIRVRARPGSGGSPPPAR